MLLRSPLTVAIDYIRGSQDVVFRQTTNVANVCPYSRHHNSSSRLECFSLVRAGCSSLVMTLASQRLRCKQAVGGGSVFHDVFSIFFVSSGVDLPRGIA
jgi:hypothetical protein